jgi:hypothetical protein
MAGLRPILGLISSHRGVFQQARAFSEVPKTKFLKRSRYGYC